MNIEHSAWCSVVLSSVVTACDCGAQEQIDKEIELQRLRRVERAARDLVVYLDLNAIPEDRLSRLKAALEEK